MPGLLDFCHEWCSMMLMNKEIYKFNQLIDQRIEELLQTMDINGLTLLSGKLPEEFHDKALGHWQLKIGDDVIREHWLMNKEDADKLPQGGPPDDC